MDSGIAGRTNAADDAEPEEDVVIFDDPGCPPHPERVEAWDCDPLTAEAVCEPGFGCYPFVVYPTEPCQPETFGSRCMSVGVGRQGDPCNNSRCEPGFLCVATGRGTQCAQLCAFPGENTCPLGLLCGNVDLEGFGTCF